MKVKIGNVIYDSEVEPIMIILAPQDKLNIARMDKKATKYCSFPDNLETKKVKKWMKT